MSNSSAKSGIHKWKSFANPHLVCFLSHDVLSKQSLHWSRVKEKCGSVNNKHVLMYVVSGLI